MASLAHRPYPFSATSPFLHRCCNPDLNSPLSRRAPKSNGRRYALRAAMRSDSPAEPTKLVTFLGKGGSGKTTAAVLAAQYFAKEGLRTCLIIHSQDPTAEYLMGCKVGTSPVLCKENLSAVRLETTRILLEPLASMKKADSRINLTQGILEGVVGEELGVLPGMDTIFSAFEVERLINFLGKKRKYPDKEFDVVVYDGISTEEMLRMIGGAERARWYLRYIRNLAEKTDIGRLVAPSFLKLMSESVRSNGGSMEGKPSLEIWDDVEQSLQRASSAFTDPSKFRCYLVVDPSQPTSISVALRYWGCTIQAGARISGALGFSRDSSISSAVAEKMSPLDFALVPYLSPDTPVNWDVVLGSLSGKAKDILCSSSSSSKPLVGFNSAKRTVTFFMPGFDKSEIKLYQYRGGSELLVEAGDQRRIIRLPSQLQGKVAGAKFLDGSLVVTLR